MRKLTFLIVLFFALSILVSCDIKSTNSGENNEGGNNVASHYDVTVIDEFNLITNPLEKKYKAETEVYFTVYVEKANYYAEVYLNNELLESSGTISDSMVDCPYVLYEYRFIITDCATIEVKKVDIEVTLECHDWDNGNMALLPLLPNCDSITYYKCKICGVESIFNKTNTNKYKVNIPSSDKEYIVSEVQKEYEEGTLVTIKTIVVDDADPVVYVNGEKIFRFGYHTDDYWEFIFIMPSEDIVIQVQFDANGVPGDENVNLQPLGSIISWIGELEKENIDVVKSKEYSLEQEYGTLATIKYSNDTEDIENFYYLKNLYVIPVNVGTGIGGYYEEFTIYFKDGSKKKIEFVDDIVLINGIMYGAVTIESTMDKPIALAPVPTINIPYLECYSIITDPSDSPKLYVNAQYVGIIKNLGEVEFIPYQHVETDEKEERISMSIDTKYCNIRMETASVFGYCLSGYLNKVKYYKIVQGMEDAPEGFYGITINPKVS